jgi:hypothetical protein
VLTLRPDCTDAIENARITRELLSDEEASTTKPSAPLPAIQEKSAVAGSILYTTTEMEVDWTDYENIKYDYYPDADTAAFRAAKGQLCQSGHGNSLLKLLKNETREEICDQDTDWETVLAGRALFQVTLIPDKDDPPELLFCCKCNAREDDARQSSTRQSASQQGATTASGGSEH